MRLPRPRRDGVLARATTRDGGQVAGTRDALLLPGRDPVRWEQVRSADWDAETGVLEVVELGTWGHERPVHAVEVDEPGRLLELVRERVTASVVLSRHVPVVGEAGVRIIGRRPPGSREAITWWHEYDRGVDPDDPLVRVAAETALAEARSEVGEPV